ncbi:Ribosomal RNA small subunit methyltransferase G [Corynebacterium kalinowskii]|uniref:Ribosomal RNA small subunit methyltransferase G n=1 Tax=Corynebacterium kalinowskii TaxID=2675216 RepID=A0A6B8VDI5_9CORY|nr:16S rRNA (guanine(527)-N(7))-methyltransferase RsmG [Corynebacterium kalinowskii]QGU03292.1 Ribosomal RNA small subunit methyltransferase G [Corynebacterium kalinowskii]
MKPEDYFGDRYHLAEQYHELLATDGSTRGFIGPREVPRLWERHILNCAVLEEAIPQGVKVADIGSGAGLPGIPLAIRRPDLTITLIEPLLKRSVFLSEVVDKLALDNVTVLRGRAEEKAVRAEVGLVDVVTSRAVAPLGRLAGWSLPLLRKGGKMIALKGSSVAEELERDDKEIKKAGGGLAEIRLVGQDVVEEPTTLIIVPRIK